MGVTEISFAVALIAVMALVFVLLNRRIQRSDNPLDWTQLLTVEHNGKREMSMTKLGMCVGVTVSSWAVVLLTLRVADKVDQLGYGAILGAWLVFIGGVEAYSKFMRAKTYQTQEEGK